MAATLPSDRHRVGYENVCEGNASQIQRSRRQWNIQDGPRGLLRRMRSQLAEDGDPESQVVLAKALLDNRDDDVTHDPQSGDCPRQAVFWLTRASLQGHEEATSLLQRCLTDDIGISEHNYHEVQQCLAMERQEKLARRAAQLLFSSLSDGNDFVTSSMLAGRIRGLLGGPGEEGGLSPKHTGQQQQKNCNQQQQQGPSDGCSLEARYGGERFLEEHMTAAATSYYQGYLPPLQHFLPPFHLDQHSSCSPTALGRLLSLLQRVSATAGMTPDAWRDSPIAKVFSKLVKYLGIDLIRKVKYWYYGMTSSKLIMLLLMVFCLCSVLGKDNLVSWFPWAGLCVSLLCLMMATATVLINYRHLDEFKVWSVVLRHYCSELSTETAESKFQNRWYVPYTGMLVALFVYLSFKPFVSSLLLCFQLPVLVVFSLLSLSCSLSRVGFFEHIAFSLYFVTSSARFSSLTAEYLNGVMPDSLSPYTRWCSLLKFEIDLWGSLKLYVGLGSLFHAVWLITLLVCLLRKGWLPTATLLLAAAWCNLAVTTAYSLDSTADLVYSSLLWAVIVLAPTIWGLLSIGLPAVGLVLICLQLNTGPEVMVGSLVSYIVSHYLLQRFLPNVFVVVRQVVFWSSVACLLLANSYHAPKPNRASLKWDSFHNMCVPSKETEARAVASCRRLEGMLVNWQGKVVDVSVTSFTNWPEYLLPLLPVPNDLKNFISCKLGQELTSCNRLQMELLDYERCVLLASVFGKERCSLENWTSYTFEVTLSMDSTYWKISKDSSNVVVTLNDRFSALALGLSIGETVEFEGVLSEGVGSKVPRVRATKVKCLQCKQPVVESLEHYKPNSAFYVYPIASSLCNFFLRPTLTI